MCQGLGFQRLKAPTQSQPLKLYNRLPTNLKNLEVKVFSRVLENHLKSKAYYSLEEYFQDPMTDLCLSTA
jgi:hypothetical protein